MTTSDTDFHALFLANAAEARALIPQAATKWLADLWARQERFWLRMAERVQS